ncbi:MAG TPA: hypothetical protein VN812_10355 [Candidatus Acidoferrales bacterium]|nr:hypothetical protein [Candidatus Acidoferrales bacterium]
MKSIAVLIAGMTVAFGLPLHASAAAAESIVSTTEAAAVVTVSEVVSHDGAVSGLLTNHSQRLVRDVQLVIRRSWLWNDERHPGEEAPGRSDFYTAPAEIPPGGSVRFRYAGVPLPRRTDGHFDTAVDVVGFTEVGE